MMVLKKLVAVVSIVLAGASAACHDPNAYVLTPDLVSQYLNLTSSSPSVAADGISRITITAAIDPNATSANRTITFTTTAGTLIAAGKTSTTEIPVVVDGAGRAVVELQSTTAVLTCRITAKVKDFVEVLDIPFTAPNVDDILVVATASPTAPADGFTRTRVTATVKKLGDPAQRTVTFKTSTGTLFSSQPTTNNGRQVDVPTDSAGVASVDLQSSAALETAFVSATAAGVTKNVTVQFIAPAPGSIISIAATPSQSVADSTSLVQIVATVAAGLSGDNRKVQFTASDSTFANGDTTNSGKTATITPDAGNRAVIDLKAPNVPMTVRVTATVNGVSTSTLVAFGPALPDSIFVSPDKATMLNTEENVIRVSLLRSVGVASANQVVTYSATDATGRTVGSFSKVELSTISSNNNSPLAVSSATYKPDATATPGPITIRVTVGGVTGTAVIQII